MILKSRLFHDAIQSPRRQIFTGLASQCHQASLCRMFVLTMATSDSRKVPAVGFQSRITSRTFMILT